MFHVKHKRMRKELLKHKKPCYNRKSSLKRLFNKKIAFANAMKIKIYAPEDVLSWEK